MAVNHFPVKRVLTAYSPTFAVQSNELELILIPMQGQHDVV